MVIKLDLKSKNLKSLKRFLFIFEKFCASYDNQLIKAISNKNIKKVLFSVLKSPHVNKRAQEQFEFKLYNTKIIFYSLKYLKILLFLKFLSKNFFSDIRFKVSFTLKNKSILLNMSKFYFKKINFSYLINTDINGENLFKIKF